MNKEDNKCIICNSQENLSSIEHIYFCKEHFARGSGVLGIIRYKQEHQDYEHPSIDLSKCKTFIDVWNEYIKMKTLY